MELEIILNRKEIQLEDAVADIFEDHPWHVVDGKHSQLLVVEFAGCNPPIETTPGFRKLLCKTEDEGCLVTEVFEEL
jgi:hypothetical protein